MGRLSADLLACENPRVKDQHASDQQERERSLEVVDMPLHGRAPRLSLQDVKALFFPL